MNRWISYWAFHNLSGLVKDDPPEKTLAVALICFNKGAEPYFESIGINNS